MSAPAAISGPIERAGGVVDTIVPGKAWLSSRNIVAGNPQLVELLRAELLVGRDDTYPDLGESD
mgnify:CR=1 FL=1